LTADNVFTVTLFSSSGAMVYRVYVDNYLYQDKLIREHADA